MSEELPKGGEIPTEVNYDFLQSKYTEGRTQEEALIEQAKGYSELLKHHNEKMGVFTGAPEAYEGKLPEGLEGEFTEENPLYAGLVELGKDLNLNQDGFSKIAGLMVQNEQALEAAANEAAEAEFKLLGENGKARIEAIQRWGSANIPDDMMEGFLDLGTTAKGIQALEKLISMTGSQPVEPQEVAPQGVMSRAEIEALQMEKDEYGARKMASDPEHRLKVQKAWEAYAVANPGA